MEERLFYYLAGVPVAGIFAQWLAWRLRLPSILLLLASGVVLGNLFGLNPDELLQNVAAASPESSIGPTLLFPLVSLAVAVVLFEGGLTLRLAELRESGGDVLRLCTIGVAVSWALLTVAAWQIVGIDLRVSALLGAILVVTGPTVIAPLLRHIQPDHRVGSVVKWEGIVIDPVGAVLAVLVFQVIGSDGQAAFSDALITLLITTAIGSVLGFSAGMLLVYLLKKYWIPDFLQGVVFLAAALGVFALSNWLQRESGLVTVTLLGIYLANQKQASIKHVVEFKEHLVVLFVSCLFIVLGSRLDIHQVLELGPRGLLFLAATIVVVRPLSVYLATLGSKLNVRERTFLACLAPRGIVAAAVTSIFSLELLHMAHAEHASPELRQLAADVERLVPLTFLVIVGTVAVYGLSAGPLARRLGVADPDPQGILFAGAERWIRKVALALQAEGFSVLLIDTNYRNVSAARQEGVPAECASILSEHVREEIDLGGIGRLLALTPNDEVNALAVREFVHLFGRANVYQIEPWDTTAGRRQSVGEHLRGRALFGEQLTHEDLALRIERGDEVKKTRITEEFTFDDFQDRYGGAALLLFVVDADKKLTVCTDQNTRVTAGQTVVALVGETARNSASPPTVKD